MVNLYGLLTSEENPLDKKKKKILAFQSLEEDAKLLHLSSLMIFGKLNLIILA